MRDAYEGFPLAEFWVDEVGPSFGWTRVDARLVGIWEIVGYWNGNLARGCPFDSTLKGGDESYVVYGRNIGILSGTDVAEGVLEYASFSVCDGKENWFIGRGGVTNLRVGESGCEDGHVFCGPS